MREDFMSERVYDVAMHSVGGKLNVPQIGCFTSASCSFYFSKLYKHSGSRMMMGYPSIVCVVFHPFHILSTPLILHHSVILALSHYLRPVRGLSHPTPPSRAGILALRMQRHAVFLAFAPFGGNKPLEKAGLILARPRRSIGEG